MASKSPADDSTGVDGEEVDPACLMNEMFGDDDSKLEDMDLDADEEETLKSEQQTPEDVDGDQLQLDTASASLNGTPTDDGSRLAATRMKLEGLPMASPL